MVGNLLWRDLCDVYVNVPVLKADGCSTGFEEKQVYSGLPCRLSYGKAVRGKNSLNESGREIKLFLSASYSVKPGSVIAVTRNGVRTVYKNSLPPAVYSSHQEVILEEGGI